MTSTAVPSTSMVTASGSLTFQPTVDPDVTDMDTTPPSQAVIFHSAPVFPSPPFTASAIISASAGGTSDTEAMDTTPPSQAVIFQSAPVSRQNQ
ncbi:hypothetical protein J1605_001212 [Eschrichtius robustus]|uniref:Uncharacterized protein n=1 Tax=Eschrichtius robustus TaxID=9764 RepID=A0AB34GCX3_ESCRO|nr:hypothetical protein J1605_001212 [Eschrichtius robustus]